MLNSDQATYTLLKYGILELVLGYLCLIIISQLMLIPGRKKINNRENSKEKKEAKKEIFKARSWLCIGWTLLVTLFNLCTILF